ncbi:MAG: NAD-dependent epimerase/dehydratase family protein [Chloroflexi bacterium]|nr:NAD-dependent epimerase/dehydratase family protein [Chloroflexota bacterium]
MIDSSILQSFKDKRILVTGGTGLIGRQVVSILCDAGAHVTIASLDDIRVHPAAEHVLGDLTDLSLCKEITSDKDYVFHIAGIKGSIDVTMSRPASFFVPLLMMNTNILEACRLNNVSKVLYTSSIGAYAAGEVFKEDDGTEGEPMDMFPGWAKRMAEMQVQAYRTQYGLDNFAIVRPCNVYGPGDNFDPDNAMVIPALMYRIHNGEDPLLVWGDGSAIRDFAYSEDVARGMILALYHGTDSRFVNLGSGSGYSIRELVEALHSFIPFNYEFDTSRSGGFPRRIMDISLARETLGYEPQTPLVEGLRKTWDWYLQNMDEHLKRKNYFKE